MPRRQMDNTRPPRAVRNHAHCPFRTSNVILRSSPLSRPSSALKPSTRSCALRLRPARSNRALHSSSTRPRSPLLPFFLSFPKNRSESPPSKVRMSFWSWFGCVADKYIAAVPVSRARRKAYAEELCEYFGQENDFNPCPKHVCPVLKQTV